MPVIFKYDEENNILYERGYGNISIDEYFIFRKKLSYLKIRSGLRCLADYRNAVVNFTYDEIWSTLSATQKVLDGFDDLCVGICTSNNLSYGIARMYSSITEIYNYKTKVFRSIEDACFWLGIGYTSETLKI
jgi:hypothetical protein